MAEIEITIKLNLPNGTEEIKKSWVIDRSLLNHIFTMDIENGTVRIKILDK